MTQTATQLSPEAIRQVEEKRRREAIEEEQRRLNRVIEKVFEDSQKRRHNFPDLTIKSIYDMHARLVQTIANEICLKHQRKVLQIDGNNASVFKFLLYYFNDCPLAEEVYPDKDYTLEKNIMLMGKSGAGKTITMQIFSEYLKRTRNPMHFFNLSVTQMVNYYTIHGNLDRYTYNEENSKGFDGEPVNVCLNDIGLKDMLHFGQDTAILTENFLHARNEIWTMTAPEQRKFAHLTTNLDVSKIKEKFGDEYNRLIDRFKTYNVIEYKGESRR